jgi:hypothetical protein
MRITPILERVIYLLVILLSLAVLLLAAISPPGFLDLNEVYQGF